MKTAAISIYYEITASEVVTGTIGLSEGHSFRCAVKLLKMNNSALPKASAQRERSANKELKGPAKLMSTQQRSAAVEIIRTLRERGFQAYLVGGCVRDLLLGREPADYDVATDPTPHPVMALFPKPYAVCPPFRLMLVAT